MDFDINGLTLYDSISPLSNIKPPYQKSANKFASISAKVKEAKHYAFCLSRSVRISLFDLSVIDGYEKHSGQHIKTLYIGENKNPSRSPGKLYSKSEATEKHDNYQFIVNIIYSDFRIIEQKRNCNILKLKRCIREYEDIVDIVVIDVELLFSLFIGKSQYISLPQWVPQKLRIPHTWDEVLEKLRPKHRSELRRRLKQKYQYTLSQSEVHFKTFYNEMYVPYTKKRFGELAVIHSYREFMNNISSDSYILFLLLNGKPILGRLLYWTRDQMLSACYAASECLSRSMTKGAFDVLNYFTILSAFERGCSLVDFLASRPLLDDGIFRFKRKWGTFIDKFDEPIDNIYIRACNFKPVVKSFFANNPFITRKQNKFIGKILLKEPATLRKIENCKSRYFTDGVDHLAIFCTEEISAEAIEFARLNAPRIKLYDISNSLCGQHDYCRL